MFQWYPHQKCLLDCASQWPLGREVVHLQVLTGSSTARPQVLFYGSYSRTNYHSTSQVQINLNEQYFSCVLRVSTTIHAQSRLPRNYGMAGHPEGSVTSDIRNRCRWIQGLWATGHKDQLRTLPMKGSSYKYHNYIRYKHTCLPFTPPVLHLSTGCLRRRLQLPSTMKPQLMFKMEYSRQHHDVGQM
jgi:hypothetical protein